MENIREPNQPSFFKGRILVWFSRGAASACVAKITAEKFPDAEVLYCSNVDSNEHPDSRRFQDEVSRWIGKPIVDLKTESYGDIYDVFDKTGWLVGHGMARCTIELKRAVREKYQSVGDVHVFGFSSDEKSRIKRFRRDNNDLYLMFPLDDLGMNKQDCLDMLMRAGIELPAMYKLGYKNNNCIGCVKGGAGYWNKIRIDFPDVFNRMAKQERKMGARILNVYLDELDPDAGRYESEYEVECGPACGLPAQVGG